MSDNKDLIVKGMLEGIKHLTYAELTKLGVKSTRFTWIERSGNREWKLDYPFLTSPDRIVRGLEVKASMGIFGDTLTLKIWGYVTRPRFSTVSGQESTHTLQQLKSAEMPLTVADGLNQALTWAINN